MVLLRYLAGDHRTPRLAGHPLRSFEEKRVIVPKHKGKNQTRYQVTLQENALACLRPYLKARGSLLAPARAVNREGLEFGAPTSTGTRERIKAAAARARVSLPDNAGRQTFISMHVATFVSIDRASLEGNTSPAMIKQNYLDIVSQADAAKYWAIYPRLVIVIIPHLGRIMHLNCFLRLCHFGGLSSKRL